MAARRAMRWALAGASALWLAGAAGAAGAPAVARAGFDAASARAAAVKPAVPELAQLPARALLLIREDTGAVVLSQNASAELAIASTTKLMTAYVTLQHEPLSARLAVDPYAAGPGESLAPVPVGTRLSVPDMLRAMLLPSGNNIAYSLALDVGGTVAHFVSMMNAAAAKLNMGRTHYTTPIGLDTPGDNYSTARDLAILARVVMRDALIREIVDERSATLSDGVTVINRNDLVGAYPWVVGVKTGSTFDAAECLVGAARLGGVRLISVVLGAPSIPARDADTLALLRYGLSLFRSARIAVAGETYATVPIRGRSRAVALIAAESATLVLARTSVLHAALEVPRRLSGPIAAGTREGSIEVSEDGRPVESVALVTATAVPAPPPSPPKIVSRAASGQRLVWIAGGGGLSATLVGCSLLLMRRRIARGAVGTAR